MSRARGLLASASCAVALVGVAACGSGSEGGGSVTASSASDPASRGASDAAAGLVGPGCGDYAKQVPDGPGSIAGMAGDPAPTAASNNPLLTTLVKAVSGQLNPQVKLIDSLDTGELTIFAPVDDAFAKLSGSTVTSLSAPAGATRLRRILTTHVVSGRFAPSDVDGTKTTLAGGTITVKGSGDDITVNGAHVICGGVQTANATVYLIDSVLDPAGGHF